MHQAYKDIRDKLGEATWYDENAVPRYCEFSPKEFADIYAREGILFEIACQRCGYRFEVAMSTGPLDRYDVEALIKAQLLHYGDPPNIECCYAGPTMPSEPIRVLQFWKRNRDTHDWERLSELEIEIEDEVYAGRKKEEK